MKGSTFDSRFGILLRSQGVAAIPNALFAYQGELALSLVEVGLIAQLLSFRWTEEAPYPSLSTLSTRTGTPRATLSRLLHDLSDRGFVAIEARKADDGGNTSNAYHLEPLFARLEQIIRGHERENETPLSHSYGTPLSHSYENKVDTSESDSEEERGASKARRSEGPQIAPNGAIVLGFFERYAEILKGQDGYHRADTLALAFKELFGREPHIPRLGHLAKTYGAGETLRALVKAAADWRGIDDPLDLAQKILVAKAPRGNGRGSIPTYLEADSPEYLAQKAEEEAWERKTRPNARS